MSNDTFHSDPVMRLMAQRAARAAEEENQTQDIPKESRSVTMIIYTWAAVGLVAFGVATTSLVTRSGDQSSAQIAAVPVYTDEQMAKVASDDDEIDLITTSSINVEPTVPSLVNVYPRSHKPSQSNHSHGAQIGSGSDIDGLVATVTALEKRSPDLMKEINPLVHFDDKGVRITANLIAGPFASREASSAFCEAVKTKTLLPCKPSAYQGDPLLDD